MRKKVPHSLDTEELLKRITNSEPEEVTTDSLDGILLEEVMQDDVLSFLSAFNIQHGEERIRRTTLYNIYRAWSMSPVQKTSFHLQVGNYIPVITNYYAINQNSIKLTYDAYKNFKKTKSQAKSKLWVSRVEDFLNFNAVKDGPLWLEIDILYFLYDKFEHERGHPTKVSKRYFEKIMDVFLKNKVTEKSKLYAVSENIKNQFQPGQLERMKKTYAIQEKQKQPRPRKKKPKK